MSFKIVRLDHLVLTVASIDDTIAFYERIMNMTTVRFGADDTRVALRFGDQKINLHQVGREFEPKAARPTAGSGDLCFIVSDLEEFEVHLAASDVTIIDRGARSGAVGTIRSVYFRDPDQNLIEVSTYDAD